MTKGDVASGARCDDVVTRPTFGVDIHSTKLMAGRCISGDFIAHSSYRVTGNAVAMGEASGAVAALATKNNRLLHEVRRSEGSKLVQSLARVT